MTSAPVTGHRTQAGFQRMLTATSDLKPVVARRSGVHVGARGSDGVFECDSSCPLHAENVVPALVAFARQR